jgi:hypothetical protein
MNSLNLSPFPSLRFEETSGSPGVERVGFVDESVVLSLLIGPTMPRQQALQKDLALSSDEMDFAGWCLTSRLPARATEAEKRRPAPPMIEETGIGEPHQGSHRWWLAGFAGAFSTMLISLLLVTLSARNVPVDEGISIIRTPEKSRTLNTPSTEARETVRELTGTPPAL